MATSAITPPPGYTIEQPQSSLPAGYTVEGQQPAQDTSGQETNDIGKTIIVPKEGESFEDTMNRAIEQGKKTTQQDINDELKTAPGKLATVLAAAPLIGATGAAAINVPATEGAGIAAGSKAALDAIGGLPGILKGAYDWAAANPIKAYVLYEVTKDLAPKSIAKIFHLASKTGE